MKVYPYHITRSSSSGFAEGRSSSGVELLRLNKRRRRDAAATVTGTVMGEEEEDEVAGRWPEFSRNSKRRGQRERGGSLSGCGGVGLFNDSLIISVMVNRGGKLRGLPLGQHIATRTIRGMPRVSAQAMVQPKQVSKSKLVLHPKPKWRCLVKFRVDKPLTNAHLNVEAAQDPPTLKGLGWRDHLTKMLSCIVAVRILQFGQVIRGIYIIVIKICLVNGLGTTFYFNAFDFYLPNMVRILVGWLILCFEPPSVKHRTYKPIGDSTRSVAL
ncbi:hypothetical protein HAX54_006998 [Datura stramonium]|uniref:Uncharacterized protein n=1 Tax=Datura stramonium TaxID=4076 RepID=A0ABS8RVF6_DATST|nr:hypothetical protein [Datura stramonium]